MTQIHRTRPTTETQRHRENTEPAGHVTTTKTQRHEDITKLTRLPARSRPPGGRGPLGVGAASDASARSCTHSQRPALSESAGLASRVDQRSAFEQGRIRRDRRALRVGRGKVRPRRMLASGAVGLFTGCRRSPDRRRFRRVHSGQPRRRRFRPFVAPLCSLCLRGCDEPTLCGLCASVVCPVRWICVICVICGQNCDGSVGRAMLESTFNATTAGRSGGAPPFSPT